MIFGFKINVIQKRYYKSSVDKVLKLENNILNEDNNFVGTEMYILDIPFLVVLGEVNMVDSHYFEFPWWQSLVLFSTDLIAILSRSLNPQESPQWTGTEINIMWTAQRTAPEGGSSCFTKQKTEWVFSVFWVIAGWAFNTHFTLKNEFDSHQRN